MEQRSESNCSLPIWLSGSLKSRDKSFSHSISSGISKLNLESQSSSSLPESPVVTPEEHFRHNNHAGLILSKMNHFYKCAKLKDVTLVAGLFCLALSTSLSLVNFLMQETKRLRLIESFWVLLLTISPLCSQTSSTNRRKKKSNCKL